MTIILPIVFMPLLMSLFMLFFGRKVPKADVITIIFGVGLSWLLSMKVFLGVLFFHTDISRLEWVVQWAYSLTGNFNIGFHVDEMTLLMLPMVSTVSLLIHVFSTSYMHGNPLYSRFIAKISFFTSAMLGLVSSNNLLFFFIFWELMGLCSYLLIGFYSWCPECGYDRETPYKAAIKAFLTTRVGDVLFFIGIAVIYGATGELSFVGIRDLVDHGRVSHLALLISSLCFLAGAIGKSAQFPLHVWLPDAMEGPSPVSALIHAATMVAAGIFLVARTAPIFPPEALYLTAWVGSFTALFSATMALVNRDYKRILAFSTISQLGYMLAAIGVGASVAGIHHLLSHAFFKALLFLGSGCVLHAMHSRSIDDCGGLAKKMPWTCLTMYAGSLSLAGFPFLFSGFHSKDEILAGALLWGMNKPLMGGITGLAGKLVGYGPYLLLTVAAALTAFYTFRMMILIFHGEPRNEKKFHHAEEQPMTMIVPLIILALFSTCLFTAMFSAPIHHILEPESHGHHGAAAEKAHHVAMVVSIVLGLAGIGFAYLMYYFKKVPEDFFMRTPQGRNFYDVLINLYWVDRFYGIFVRKIVEVSGRMGLFDRGVIDGAIDATAPSLVFSATGSGLFDRYVVDYCVNAVSDVTRLVAGLARRIQTGKIQDYALGSMVAVLLFALWISL